MKKKKPRYNKGKIKKLRERIRQAKDLPPTNRKNRSMSGLEQRVADLLDDLKIEYEREVPLKYPGSGFRYYDFCLYDYGVLIEVDGAYWQNPQGPGTHIDKIMDHPVVHISWNDASEYCSWAGKDFQPKQNGNTQQEAN